MWYVVYSTLRRAVFTTSLHEPALTGHWKIPSQCS